MPICGTGIPLMDEITNTPPSPKVSIGLPVFNGELHIQAALDSILRQSFTDFELIISDNASTDGTSVLCLGYASQDHRICYIRQENNIGAFDNFRFVLLQARGDYFMWAAHDDMLSSHDFLDRLVSALDQGCEYAFPDIDILDERSGKCVVNVMLPFIAARGVFDNARASLRVNSFQVYGLFRKEVLGRYFFFLEECKNLSCFGEGVFVHAISTEAQGCFVPEVRKTYRRHDQNASSRTPPVRLLADFCRYYAKATVFFVKTERLTLVQRVRILMLMFAPYTLYASKLALAMLINSFKQGGR